MRSEKEKMIAGELYDPEDRELHQERMKSRQLLHTLNITREDQQEERRRLLEELLPRAGKDIWIQTPFFCDYGYNIMAGEKVFINFNCVLLDVMPISIGSRTLFGPNVQVYTATHPMDHELRASGLEYAKPITIGEDVWVGGGAILCPGVSIGDRAVIGAGSVVTKDIPAEVFAAGNPCCMVRELFK